VTDNLPESGALTTIGADTARLTAARAAALTDLIDGGRLDLLIDAIKAKTDNLPADPADDSDIDTQLAAIAAAIAALNDYDPTEADTIETGFSDRQALRLIAAACCGILSGAATATNTIKGLDKSTTRISATVDADGNRSAMTYTKGS